MTLPVTRLGQRSPLSEAYVKIQFGVNAEGTTPWINTIQSPSGATPTVTGCTAAPIPNDGSIKLQDQQLIGTDFYMQPIGGIGNPQTDYQYQLTITLSDGQVLGESVQQICSVKQ